MITSYTISRFGNVSQVVVTSDLVGTVFYHWYVDGAYVGRTTTPTKGFYLAAGEQTRIEVLDSLAENFDAVANAPAAYPARRTLWWIASLADDIQSYRLDQRLAAGAWEPKGVVNHRVGQWVFWNLSPRLDDLSEYTWRVVPLDRAGNEGTPYVIGPELVVRTPDAPPFAVAWDPQTRRVTFAAA